MTVTLQDAVAVEIPPNVQRWLRDVAAIWARKRPSTEQRTTTAARIEGNYRGLACQWAAAKYVDVPDGINVQRGGDDGWDIELPGGCTVEVKWTAKDKPPIFLPFKDAADFRADVAVLGTGSDEPRLIGWVSRERFLAGAFRADFGYGPRLCYDYRQLEPMRSLRARQLGLFAGNESAPAFTAGARRHREHA